MGPSIEECGKTIGRMAKVHSGMPMAINMKGSLRMTSPMGTASILAQMGLSTRVFGSMTSSTGRAKQSGQMAQAMLEIMSKVSDKVLEHIPGRMRINTAENG